MLETEKVYKYIKFSSYSKLENWGYNNQIEHEIESKYPIDIIGNHIINEAAKKKLYDYPDEKFHILGISNEVGLFDAYEDFGKNFNQGYKRVENDWIAYNPYRINVGSIGLKRKNIKNSYISPAYVVFSCKDTVLPEYIYYIMKSNYFLKCIQLNTTGSVRQTLSFKNLSKIKIPIPSIIEQKKLVDEYNKQIAIVNEKNMKAKFLENTIDKKLFELLCINPIKTNNTSDKYLHKVNNKDLIKWGVNINLAPANPKALFKSDKYDNKLLSSIAEINPKTIIPKSVDELTFLPMENISDVYGEIKKRNIGHIDKVKGYTKFKNGDILWAKITPCMENGKCAIADDLESGYGYGSTEYHVIRVKEDIVLKEFIYCLLRTNVVRDIAKYYFTGSAGQQRVGEEFLKNLIIPLPKLKSENTEEVTQKLIVDIIFNIKNNIQKLRSEGEQLKESASKQFEEHLIEQ